MDGFQIFDPGLLDSAGLNLQAVFNIDQLPPGLIGPIPDISLSGRAYRQLILIGHAGTRLWERVKESGPNSENPIDDFTVETVKQWFAGCQPRNNYRLIYPGSHAIGLQRLGQLAGWHNPSPFMVGIDPEWGTWYAYRAAVLADTHFEPTRPAERESPCKTCERRPCITACPGEALEGNSFDLGKCVAYRRQAGSACRATCLARISCPVGSAHRYCDDQIRHTYSNSLKDIERYERLPTRE